MALSGRIEAALVKEYATPFIEWEGQQFAADGYTLITFHLWEDYHTKIPNLGTTYYSDVKLNETYKTTGDIIFKDCANLELVTKKQITPLHLTYYNSVSHVGKIVEVYTMTFKCYHDISGAGSFQFRLHVRASERGTYLNNYFDVDINLDYLNRAVPIVNGTNFNDEENPVLTYTANDTSDIKAMYAALSYDGITPVTNYKEVPITATTFTIELTEAEREALRAGAIADTTVPIYYMLKTVRTDGINDYEFIAVLERMVTIIGCLPVLNPTVKDIKLETLALTGDENTFIRYESMAEYAINAAASKNAVIVKQSVTCGSKTIADLPNGVIDDVESADFNFYVLDSRNQQAASAVFKNLIEYVKPTCYQKPEVALSGETSVNIKLNINGSYFNGSFGAANNELKLEVRYTNSNGDMGEWQTISAAPTFNKSTYSITVSFAGFDYGESYTFQSRITDKLNTVESAQYVVRLLPVFDWSETDFNFNVPVNINAEELSLNEETIIRHSKTTNNTVLSGSGGNIYLRPGGTNNTANETIFYGNGNIVFGGAVELGDSFTIEGNKIADFIVETGEEAMGSNGTWYWAKWNSGKAECWGCRNFGNTAVTTTWGGLYRSAIFTQNLPEDLFKTTPDVITMNIVNSNFGGWLCKHENLAPSAITTGSFIFVRPASATVSPLYIGFHIIGLWK